MRVRRGSFGPSRPCAHCGGPFEPSGKNAMYCRKACKVAAWRISNPERLTFLRAADVRERTVSVYHAGYCLCGAPMGGRRQRNRCDACDSIAKAEASRVRGEALHRQDARVKQCEECACSFCPMYGYGQATLCAPCSIERKRAHRDMSKALRRARETSEQAEVVNPYKVFARDGWMCRLCGVSTPRAKRGTYDADAPELDHVVPLSKGGPHTYANTQCACRRCNGAKSDALGWESERAGAA